MALLKEKKSFQPSLKTSPQERDHIVQAHKNKNLEDMILVAQYAVEYQKLGWSMVALDADTGLGLEVDFAKPLSTWLSLLLDLAVEKTKVSLAIRLEPDSQLFVLKVNLTFGKTFLDSLGDWRSSCVAYIAWAEDIWEQHFFILPKTWHYSPGHNNDDEEAPLSLMGPGRVVAVPSSIGLSSQETWRWLKPPWQHPPRHPAQGLLLLLEKAGYISRKVPASDSSETLWNELNFLATLASELEQQVDQLERQHLSSTAEPTGSSSSNLIFQQDQGELAELRRLLEKYLLRDRDLLDSK